MKQKMKRITALCLTAMLLLGLLPLAAAAGDTGAVEQKAYVSAGLTAWFDGTNNSNGTQRISPDLWKDLTGNTNHIDVVRGFVDESLRWQADMAFIDPEKGYRMRLFRDLIDLVLEGEYTIELVFGDLTWADTATPYLLNSEREEFSLTASRNSDGTVDVSYRVGESDSGAAIASGKTDSLSGVTLAITAENKRAAAANVFLYADGEKLGEAYTEGVPSIEYLYLGHDAADKRWGGQLYGFRVYNRPLTPEELAANAAADSFNYREGNVIAPVQRYDPQLDIIACGPDDIDGVESNDRIPVNGETDMIPISGFYGSTNLFDYLYPFETDEKPWEGARIMRVEDPKEDLSGKPIPYVSFMLCYDIVCMRASLRPRPVDQVAYLALAYRADGEIDGVEVAAICYDAENQEAIDLPFAILTADSITGDGTGDVRYLAFRAGKTENDLKGEEDYLAKLKVKINGLDEGDAFYLTELSLFATEADMCAYTGLEPTEPLPEPETEPETEPEIEPVTDAVPDENHGGNEPETESDHDSETTAPDNGAPDNGNADEGTTAVTPAPEKEGGCTATVGFGMIAILTAALILPVLKKRE